MINAEPFDEYKYAPYPYAIGDVILGCEADGTKVLKIIFPKSQWVINLELSEEQFESGLKAIKLETEKCKDD